MRAAPLTRSRRVLPAIDADVVLGAAAVLLYAYAAAVLLVCVVLALLVPYHFWDSLAFGEWSRLIGEHGGFHFPSVTVGDLQRPFFYVAQGWLWRITGFHEETGRLLSLAFAVLLAAAVALLARRPHPYARLEAALALLLLLSCAAFLEQAFSGMSDVPASALVAATGVALWVVRLRPPLRFALIAALAACAGLAKTTALLALGGLFLASLLGRRAGLRARVLDGALPIGVGTALALGYYEVQARHVGRSLPGLLRAGTGTGYYAQIAGHVRSTTILQLHWLGPGSALPLLLAFALLYSALRLGGAGHRTGATVAAPLALLVSWLGPWVAAGEHGLRVGPLATPTALAVTLLLAGPLLVARECPEELAPGRLGIGRLVLWFAPPLAAWLYQTPYAPRLAAAAWPGLIVLLAATLVPAVVASARRGAAAAAVPVVALLVGAVPLLVNVDEIAGPGWSRLAALTRSQWLDRTAVRRAVSSPGLADAIEAARREAGPDGKIYTSSGEFRFAFPGRVTQLYPRSCRSLEGYRVFVLLLDTASAAEIRGAAGAGAASPSFWSACREPSLTPTLTAGSYTVFRVNRPA